MTREPNHQVLIEILNETRQAQKAGASLAIVFDLDSTLFNVTARNQKILDEFIDSEHLEVHHHELKASLKTVELKVIDHGLDKALRRSGIDVTDEALRNKLIHFWRERFFSDAYLELDRPFEGAAEYVRDLHDLGSQIYYLTGRDWIRMGTGTPRELLRWGFPVNEDRAKLIMKPQKGLDDADFKVAELQKLPQVHWLFENEPKIIHAVEEALPNLKIVFFDSSHSGKAEPKSHWVSIQHFKR